MNRMRTLISTTAPPPINLLWTKFIMEQLPQMHAQRNYLAHISRQVKQALLEKGLPCTSDSHILPIPIGDSGEAVIKAEALRRKGFYLLPIRPPTVPEGTARLRISLTAQITTDEIDKLLDTIASL